MLTQATAAPYLVWHQPNRVAIPCYDVDTAQINSILANLRAVTDGISLNLMLKQGAVAGGEGATFLDFAPNGRLLPDVEAKLTDFLTQLHTLDFHWIFIELEFWGVNDPRKNPFSETLYDPCWFFVTWLVGTLEEIGIPWMLDPCPEVNDKWKSDPDLGGQPNLGLQQYAKRLWTDITGYYYPNARPPWKFSLSFIPRDLDVLEEVFQGNRPPILLPHLYSNELGGLGMGLSYVASNLPSSMVGRPWIVSEIDTLQPGQEAVAQTLATFTEQTAQPIIRVCPWQLSVLNPAAVIAPPIAPTVWKGVGA